MLSMLIYCYRDLKLLTSRPTLSTYWPNGSKIEDYELGQLIGRGAYAEVKYSTNLKTGEKYAIK